ncbi:helix-turn-helix transcriptional regulator [Sphingobium sufflavum]|uniref:winged helix-turn-helix transcriptional regulator n=1 Tax=Sphingobium sufflavum TaxID=1129547 RepID=UPI001F479F7C|nr:helix-turn-helix domain-containing protein [Sphingobium sufflavum]MCE7795277.1 helix-turn-helix transcriptional regulator [Sphingobium sufflavum]
MAHALDLVGDRWALAIVRELMLGPRRFGDLRADLPGLSANVLTQRLGDLERDLILVRRKLPPPAHVQVYELTAWGYEAEPIIQELGRWAARSPGHDATLPISGVSILLSFRTMIARDRVGEPPFSVGFRFGAEEYLARLDAAHPDRIVVERGAEAEGDIGFIGAPNALAAFIYGDVPEEALAGALTVRGKAGLVARFARLFGLPEKVRPKE